MPSGAASAHSARMARGHHPGERPVHAAWRGARQRNRGLSVMRSSAHPSILLRLQTATPTPRWWRRKRGSHRGSGRLSGGAQRQSGQTASNSDESSQARFLSCTSMPRVLEARRRSFPTMRSDTKSSHWQRAGVTRVIPDGWRRSGPMVVKPGAKQLQGVGD
jgi:hypothetical protein